jgi:hypothetical protein
VLASGEVSAGAGVSGRFASSATERVIDRGRSAADANLADPVARETYALGLITEAVVAPGASPWLALRVGLPESTEAGMTYTGRSLRVDGRHALRLDGWALSIGLGASAVLESIGSESPGGAEPAGAETDLSVGGWGIDLPVVVGYRSVGEFLDFWAGGRIGYDAVEGELSPGSGTPPWTATGDRLWASALGGFSVGVPPVWLHVEVDATFHRLSGELTGAERPAPPLGRAEHSGWTLSPSAGLVGRF